jgi:hypothetical protein
VESGVEEKTGSLRRKKENNQVLARLNTSHSKREVARSDYSIAAESRQLVGDTCSQFSGEL